MNLAESPAPSHAIEILLVEDNPNDLELTLRAFQVHQLTNTIHVVRDGVEAIEFLFPEDRGEEARPSAGEPDLILLDLNLPRLSGKEVLARVRADRRTRHIPVIVFTSSKDDADLQECLNLGANGYIVKPTDFGQFAVAVRKMGMQWSLIASTPAHA
jgi:two-component system response regulator